MSKQADGNATASGKMMEELGRAEAKAKAFEEELETLRKTHAETKAKEKKLVEAVRKFKEWQETKGKGEESTLCFSLLLLLFPLHFFSFSCWSDRDEGIPLQSQGCCCSREEGEGGAQGDLRAEDCELH